MNKQSKLAKRWMQTETGADELVKSCEKLLDVLCARMKVPSEIKADANGQVRDDYLSEIWLNVFKGLREGRWHPKQQEFSSWLYQTAKDTIVDMFRKNEAMKRQADVVSLDILIGDADEAGDISYDIPDPKSNFEKGIEDRNRIIKELRARGLSDEEIGIVWEVIGCGRSFKECAKAYHKKLSVVMDVVKRVTKDKK